MKIKEISRILGIPPHTLRFWEKELGLKIPRNEDGERVYDQKNLTIFKKVVELRKRGMGLKFIKELLQKNELENFQPEGRITITKEWLNRLENLSEFLRKALEE